MFYEFKSHVVDPKLCSLPSNHTMLFRPGRPSTLDLADSRAGSDSSPSNADGLRENEDDPLVLGPSPI